MDSALRVGVVGVGHLGKSHARVYSELLDAQLVGVADACEERGHFVAEGLGVPCFSGPNPVEALIDGVQPDALSIVVPTSMHYGVASVALLRGVHVLVEKPVTTTLAEAKELLRIADARGLVLQVGHVERFNSAVRYVSGNVRDPIFLESHRVGPFTPRVADVGVVLDLMIHDIDIFLSLVPSPISRIAAAGRCVLSEHEDVACAQITFENGTMGQILVSRVAERKMRQLDIMECGRHITVNYETQDVEIRCRRGDNREILERPVFPKCEPLKLELAHFVNCVRMGRQPLVGIRDGVRALEVAIEVLRQIGESSPRSEGSKLPEGIKGEQAPLPPNENRGFTP
ncbi:MAG: Gfo/Idh/MocA family oxidoreductase [Synergistaceae bacterium]|nr:Gfo/Idh/MocA family oxidoreductase [Synergistaceae bacterium]